MSPSPYFRWTCCSLWSSERVRTVRQQESAGCCSRRTAPGDSSPHCTGTCPTERLPVWLTGCSTCLWLITCLFLPGIGSSWRWKMTSWQTWLWVTLYETAGCWRLTFKHTDTHCDNFFLATCGQRKQVVCLTPEYTGQKHESDTSGGCKDDVVFVFLSVGPQWEWEGCGGAAFSAGCCHTSESGNKKTR